MQLKIDYRDIGDTQKNHLDALVKLEQKGDITDLKMELIVTFRLPDDANRVNILRKLAHAAGEVGE